MATDPPTIMIMSGTPESRQPYSVMHRALYANIVGEESLTGFAHGCTVKQYDGRDYLVDHVTRLARPLDSFPIQTVISEEQLDLQQAHLDGLKHQLDELRPKVKELENRVREAHNYENKLSADVKAIRINHKEKAKAQTPKFIANTIPTSETHLKSLIAQVLRSSSHTNISHLSSADIKALKTKAPSLAAYYFRYKSGTIEWGKPLGPRQPKPARPPTSNIPHHQ